MIGVIRSASTTYPSGSISSAQYAPLPLHATRVSGQSTKAANFELLLRVGSAHLAARIASMYAPQAPCFVPAAS
jgi:hypothetical protein